MHEEESKKADSNRKVEEEVETESSAKLDRLRTTKKGKTIFGGDAQRYPAKSYLFEIETIEVKTFLLKMALIENPIYYFSIKTSHSDEVVFSSYVDSQLLEWHDENLLVRIPENCSVIVLTLHEKTFCTWNNETKKLVPIDIISFSMEIPKMVKEGLHKYVEYVADASISDEFRSFVRKNKIINEDSYVKDPIAALEKTKIKIQYELNGTFFIDNPCGIFNVTAIKGEGIHKIAIDGSKKKIKTSIQMSIENQNIIFDGEVDEQNPIWTKNASLITFNAQDVIMIRIFETDVDKTNPIIDAFINLHLIQIFEDGEQLSHTIDLSKSNTYMKGMLTFDFTYTAVKQNSSKKIKEIDLKDPKQKSALDMFYEKTFSMEKPKIPELPDWLSVYSNKINKVQIDLDEIELDLKQLKGPYIVQNIFKLGDQIFVGKQFYNVSEIRYNEKIEFLSSPAKENERNINILIKVVDFYNPNRILRVYTYYFDYLKHIQSDKTFIEINKKLIASSLYSPDPDDTSNITFRYKYFEPLFKNLPSKIGMIFIRPSQIRLSGTYNHEKPIWHPMTGYFLEMAFNGVKQVIKLKPGKPKTESLIQILNETVYRYSEKQFDGTDFFIDAKDLNQDSILDVSIDRTVICFPLRKINDNFIKVKLYQIDTEGLSSGQFNPRMNPFSKLIARGKIDIDHLKELPKVSWAVNLHKEANLIMHENISDIIHTNLMQIFLTFNMDYKMTDLFEPVKFKPNLKSKGHKVDEQAESILTIIKEMKFNFVNHEKPLLFAKAIQFKEKQARSGGNSELNCPLRSLVTNKINALRAAGVSYNPLTSLFDHRIYMEERIKKTTQLSVISLDFKPETEVGDIKKLDPAAFLNMKPSLHDLNLPQDILGKKDQTVIYHTEIK